MSRTLNIYRDLLTSLSIITLGAFISNLLNINNRRNISRDNSYVFYKKRASAYLDNSIKRSLRSDLKIISLRTLLK